MRAPTSALAPTRSPRPSPRPSRSACAARSALVLDDVHALAPDGAAVRAVEALCRQASGLAASRARLARLVPLFDSTACAGRGRSSSSAAPTSPSTSTRCCAVLEAELDDEAGRASPPPLHAVTEGWPAAVRLACEAVRALEPAQARRDGRAAAPARRPAVRLPGARGARPGAAGRARSARHMAAPLERVHPGAVRRPRDRGCARRPRFAGPPRPVRREPLRSTAGSSPPA